MFFSTLRGWIAENFFLERRTRGGSNKSCLIATNEKYVNTQLGETDEELTNKKAAASV